MYQLKDYSQISCQLSSRRYEQQEGFSDEQRQPQIMISQNQLTHQSSNNLDKKKAKPRFHEPRTKLKFIAHEQPIRVNMQHTIADKQFQSRNSHAKSLQFRRKQPSNKSISIIQPVIKSKRTLVGQNLTIPPYAQQDFKTLKQLTMAEGGVIYFQSPKQVNTHGFIRKIYDHCHAGSHSFLSHRFNSLLKQRLKNSFIVPKHRSNEQKINENKLVFNNEMENGNLQLAVKVTDTQYDLYLRIDTNTHGHQNWFHFQVTNLNQQSTNYSFNVCNVKRPFKLIDKGQKIFMKLAAKGQKWEPAGHNIRIGENTNPKIGRGRLYKLSFNLQLKHNTKYCVAMLPAYTYSQMLLNLDQIERKYKNLVQVELLNYSLTGLAIPIVTITNKQCKNQDKKLILISSRIHPGESVSSYVTEGLMKKLLDQDNKGISEMLKTTIFKIIPMLNPDGVVFGNFRTNYLGIDLNRAFHTEDEIINPQVWSLKNLGRQLKSQYGNHFIYFLDMHGHSSEKNVFSYGPNFQYKDPNFYLARLLPKLLSTKSKYFKYSSCSFKLQQHKQHTARGFFLNGLNVMTYTIQSTFSIYDDNDGVEKIMKVQDWIAFGMDLAEGLENVLRIRQSNSIKSNRDLKLILNTNQAEEAALIKKMKSEIKKQSKLKQKSKQIQDSDGESEGEDLTLQQRQQTQKKIIQFTIPSFSLPKVLKPAILYPTITPKLFEVNEQRDESNYKILYTKRAKYNTLRMMNANSIYANYLKNSDELQKFKPSARNIKLQKKLQV